MNNRILINSIKDILGLDDYKAISTGAGAVSLVNGNNRIIFGYNKYPKIYVLGPQLLCYKTFPEVENILEPYYKKYNLGYQPYTIHTSSRRFEKLSLIDLITPEDIHQVAPELKTMVYDDILPFFEEFQNIQAVLVRMESLPKEDISKFICHSPVPRMMILKKIGNSTNWIEFCEWAVDIYKSMSSGPNGKQYEVESMLINDLYKKLKSINL